MGGDGGVGEQQGSSPRRRGKPPHETRPLQPIGAHPRVGGENECVVGAGAGGGGSSPRRRGKLASNGVEGYADRLIPA